MSDQQYYKKFKESHPEHNASISCGCGGHFTYYTKPRHVKTTLHIRYVKHQEEIAQLTATVGNISNGVC